VYVKLKTFRFSSQLKDGFVDGTIDCITIGLGSGFSDGNSKSNDVGTELDLNNCVSELATVGNAVGTDNGTSDGDDVGKELDRMDGTAEDDTVGA